MSHRFDDIVTDPDVLARLPRAGKTTVEFWWLYWFDDVVRMVRRGSWHYWRLYFTVRRMRFANAESITIGPMTITRPAPWLMAPARTMYPQAFEANAGKGGK